MFLLQNRNPTPAEIRNGIPRIEKKYHFQRDLSLSPTLYFCTRAEVEGVPEGFEPCPPCSFPISSVRPEEAGSRCEGARQRWGLSCTVCMIICKGLLWRKVEGGLGLPEQPS